ncbi:TPA_asm: hypothetical protein [Armillaria novae-zelandiae ambi-like virus 1]|uniref:Uncharacterized protein n=1 Tax=Armillaria novae-zelandiae ambi-like virus 1 TaxID=2803970 RepID=A0A8D9PCR1_9VIRU|nr:TPA_asm: hypothetical protein [Armillaria novae-zelandiae ambi-like virus 1]
MKLFTSIPSPINNISSSIFSDNGNPGESSAKISDINVYSLPVQMNNAYIRFKEWFCVHVAAALRNESVVYKPAEQVYMTIEGVPKGLIFPSPPVGIAVPGMSTEHISASMARLGFIKESVGRAPFFRGVVTDESIAQISRLHPNIDTSVPYGVTSLRGWMTYRLCERLLIACLKTFPGSLSKSDGKLKSSSYQGKLSKTGGMHFRNSSLVYC